MAKENLEKSIDKICTKLDGISNKLDKIKVRKYKYHYITWGLLIVQIILSSHILNYF